MNPINLSASRLSAMRGGQMIFRNINFSLSQGNCLFLTGPNGSGKSTLLRVVAGLLQPSEGILTYKNNDYNIDISKESYYSNRKEMNDLVGIHYIGDTDHIKIELTPYENLIHWSSMLYPNKSNLFHMKNSDNSLQLLSLDNYKNLPSRFLSLGQRKRLSLAKLLLKENIIWLLDEPTLGLDKKSIHFLEDLIECHRNRGGIILISTHSNIKIKNVSSLEMI